MRLVLRWVAAAVPLAMLIGILFWVLGPGDPARRAARAESAAQAGDWEAALKEWRAVNRTRQASAQSLLGEARACLALGRAAQAERALVRANEAAPADPAPWLLRLSLLHLEDRILEAQQLGWVAYAAVGPPTRRDVLRALTAALLSDIPDDAARVRLSRWVASDSDDTDAQIALLGRITALPRAGDPDRDSRIAALTGLLARNPRHLGAREALVIALADAGDLDRGRAALEAWPPELRDARYNRLRGRWDLEYGHQPAQAVEALRRALADLPHDWRTHYRLARALNSLGATAEAHREAETVSRLREVLDPDSLGHRLIEDFDRLDDAKARLDLAGLCTTVGLYRLADAWRAESSEPSTLRNGLRDVGLHEPLLNASSAEGVRTH